MPQDNRTPEGVVPAPGKPPIPGSVLSEVSPISDVAWGPNEQSLSRMSQRLGDVEYRAELVPELASNPLATLGYESIREKTGGDVSQLIKHIMSNVETGEVRGDDPEDPIFGTNVRGTHGIEEPPIIRVNTTDRIDKFGEKWIKRGEYDRLRQAQYEGGGDEVLAHELGHEALDNLFAQGKADELARIYGEDVITVMDYLRYADLLGDVNPRSSWRPKKTRYERESDTVEERLNHPRVAISILTKGHDQFHGTIGLTPYEQQVANLVVKVNREAAKQLTEKGISTEYPTPLSSNSLAAIDKYMEGSEITGVKRAAGGFVDRPLYDRKPYG